MHQEVENNISELYILSSLEFCLYVYFFFFFKLPCFQFLTTCDLSSVVRRLNVISGIGSSS